MSILGTRVIRTEDPRLLTSGGVYVDDLSIPELAQAKRLTFVRSPIGHARITGIDTAAAMAAPAPVAWGVVPAIFLIPCVLVMFLIAAMSFEMLHSLIGYEPASKPSGALVKWVARTFGEKLPD